MLVGTARAGSAEERLLDSRAEWLLGATGLACSSGANDFDSCSEPLKNSGSLGAAREVGGCWRSASAWAFLLPLPKSPLFVRLRSIPKLERRGELIV